MIERDDGVKLVVGEVNLASSAGRKEGGPGEFQLLAELYTHVAAISATPEGSGVCYRDETEQQQQQEPTSKTLHTLHSLQLPHEP